MSPVTLLLAFAAPSVGFAPTDSVFTGIEPQRIRWQHGPVQAEWLASPAFQRFLATEGAGWQARFDEATGTPRMLWGGGIAMPTGSGTRVASGVAQLLGRHPALFGVQASDLRLRSAHYDPPSETWYLDFDTLRAGLPTYRGGISARVERGNLVLLHVATSPRAEVTGAFHLNASQAIARAIRGGPAPTATHTGPTAEPMLLERSSLQGMTLARTFLVRTRTVDPPGMWVTFVDAATGELLSVHNEVRFIAGTVEGLHHERTVDGSPLIQSPLPDLAVDGDVDSDITDDFGAFDVTAGAAYTGDLHGEIVDMDNDAGDDAIFASLTPDILWTSAVATQAEIDGYVFLNQVIVWGARVAPINPWPTLPFESLVNMNATCNAYWDLDGTHFYQAGGGCNNTGQIADVNYHEWGHGFHYYSIQAGIFDGSLSEGAADTVAFFNTGDSLIGPGFFTGGGAIRDVAPNKVYPQDFVNNYYYVHANGLIFGGAMWDLQNMLNDDLGDPTGKEAAEQIFAGLLKGGTDIPGTFPEALLADDDDGNLSNGTPNQCTIIAAFGLHGLGDIEGGGSAFIFHEPLVNVPADVATAITVDVTSVAPDCITVTPETGVLHYRIDKGPWKEVVASVSGADVEADIPAQPYGTFLEYWVDGEDTEGEPFSAPVSGQFAPYTTFVGETLELNCEDFENNDAEFIHKLIDGSDVEGADDWQWGSPAGVGGDPSFAFSGDKVWGNDLGNDNYNGLYQADKVNRLRSVRLETAHYTEVFLQYRRWLNVEDGIYDQAVITANGEPVWDNWSGDGNGGEDHEDRQWISHSVDMKGLADRGDIQIGWELYTDDGIDFGGWTLDDVCIVAPATPDNRLGITDFTAVPNGIPTTLGWTNPIHLPVERVVVIRNPAHWPTSWEDGQIVLDVSDPVPGERVDGVDPNLDGLAGYYAVYASDGVDWLSWTIEGWNAARVLSRGPSGLGPFLPDEGAGGAVVGAGGGCGCADAPTAPSLFPVGLLGLLAVRRRR